MARLSVTDIKIGACSELATAEPVPAQVFQPLHVGAMKFSTIHANEIASVKLMSNDVRDLHVRVWFEGTAL